MGNILVTLFQLATRDQNVPLSDKGLQALTWLPLKCDISNRVSKAQNENHVQVFLWPF